MMKNRYSSIIRKSLIVMLLIPAPSILTAQVLHEVSVANFSFSPQSLEINAGDTIRWTNQSGFHNINGTTAAFPANPVSFGNETGSGWVYSFIFDIPGTYNYRCDVHTAMTGSINVNDVLGNLFNPSGGINSTVIYPVPASDYINIDLSGFDRQKTNDISVFSNMGIKVLSVRPSDENITRLDISGLAPGVYVLTAVENDNLVFTGRFIAGF